MIRKQTFLFLICIIPPHWNDTGGEILLLWKMIAYPSFTVNFIAVDDLFHGKLKKMKDDFFIYLEKFHNAASYCTSFLYNETEAYFNELGEWHSCRVTTIMIDIGSDKYITFFIFSQQKTSMVYIV